MTLHSRIAELRQDNEQPKILSLTFGERYWQERATALADDCEKLLEKVGAFLDWCVENGQVDRLDVNLDWIKVDGDVATRAREFKKELGIE